MSRRVGLVQFLMKTGKFYNSRDVLKAIKSGRVKVEGEAVTDWKAQVRMASKEVTLDGQPVRPVGRLYFILNKPAGFESQKAFGKKSVFDLIEKLVLTREEKSSLYPVGRLDRETSGLMIVTNDGRLFRKLTDPKEELEKGYYAELRKALGRQDKVKLEAGVEVELETGEYKTQPARVELLGGKKLRIFIKEGKKRQIRKMFKALGNEVLVLRRESVGGLRLQELGLEEGQFREFGFKELSKLIGLEPKK
jgi:16S rRNA pseudouridine516 synthase